MNKKICASIVLSLAISAPVQPLSDHVPPVVGGITAAALFGPAAFLLHKTRDRNVEFLSDHKTLLLAGAAGIGSLCAGGLTWYVLRKRTPAYRLQAVLTLLESYETNGLCPSNYFDIRSAAETLLGVLHDYEGSEQKQRQAWLTYDRMVMLLLSSITNEIHHSVANENVAAVLSQNQAFNSEGELLGVLESLYLRSDWITEALYDMNHACSVASNARDLMGMVVMLLEVDLKHSDQDMSDGFERKAHEVERMLNDVERKLSECIRALTRLQVYRQAERVVRELEGDAAFQTILSIPYSIDDEDGFLDEAQDTYGGGTHWHITANASLTGAVDNARRALQSLNELHGEFGPPPSFAPNIHSVRSLLEEYISASGDRVQTIYRHALYHDCHARMATLHAQLEWELVSEESAQLSDAELWAWAERQYRAGWYNTVRTNLTNLNTQYTSIKDDLVHASESASRGATRQRCKRLSIDVSIHMKRGADALTLFSLHPRYKEIEIEMSQLTGDARNKVVLGHRNAHGLFAGLQGNPYFRRLRDEFGSESAWPFIEAEQHLIHLQTNAAQLAGRADALLRAISPQSMRNRAVAVSGLVDSVHELRDTVVDRLTFIQGSSGFREDRREKQDYERQQQQARHQQAQRTHQQRQQAQEQQAPQRPVEQAVASVLVPMVDDVDDSEPCLVCLDVFTEEDTVVVLRCCGGRKALHPECYDGWHNRSNSCPNCRAQMSTQQMSFNNWAG